MAVERQKKWRYLISEGAQTTFTNDAEGRAKAIVSDAEARGKSMLLLTGAKKERPRLETEGVRTSKSCWKPALEIRGKGWMQHCSS